MYFLSVNLVDMPEPISFHSDIAEDDQCYCYQKLKKKFIKIFNNFD